MIRFGPWRWFKIPFSTTYFYVGAKLDKTVKWHFIIGATMTLILSFFVPLPWLFWIPFAAIIWHEVANGEASQGCIDLGCKQGFDLFDVAGFLIGVVLAIGVMLFITVLLLIS